MAKAQLAQIVAPNINEVDYSSSLNESFKKINENFKKIASLPFLQGIQGDSFQTVQYPIWEQKDKIYKVTEKGALLLNSIFNITTITEELDFGECRTKIGNFIEGVSPIDCFFNETELVNNILYFYAVIDEAGGVQVEYTGQYFYFIDARITQLSKILSEENYLSLVNFNDYSGFYQYVNDDTNPHFEKLSIVPSLYYDNVNNDICWQYNGKKTGISAVGIAGKSGVDSRLDIVKVKEDANENGVGEVLAVAVNGKWNTADVNNLSNNQPVIICFNDNNINTNFSFGNVVKSNTEKDKFLAYWDNSMIFSEFLSDKKIYNYISRIGDKPSENESKGLWIPSEKGKTAPVHMLYSSNEGLNIAKTYSPQYTYEYGNGGTEGNTLNIKNYNVVIDNTLETKYGIKSGTSIVAKGDAKAKVNGVEDVNLGLPIGSVTMWAGNYDKTPDCWLLCDGTGYPNSGIFSNLFDAIGYKYGYVCKTIEDNKNIFNTQTIYSVILNKTNKKFTVFIAEEKNVNGVIKYNINTNNFNEFSNGYTRGNVNTIYGSGSTSFTENENGSYINIEGSIFEIVGFVVPELRSRIPIGFSEEYNMITTEKRLKTASDLESDSVLQQYGVINFIIKYK